MGYRPGDRPGAVLQGVLQTGAGHGGGRPRTREEERGLRWRGSGGLGMSRAGRRWNGWAGVGRARGGAVRLDPPHATGGRRPFSRSSRMRAASLPVAADSWCSRVQASSASACASPVTSRSNRARVATGRPWPARGRPARPSWCPRTPRYAPDGAGRVRQPARTSHVSHPAPPQEPLPTWTAVNRWYVIQRSHLAPGSGAAARQGLLAELLAHLLVAPRARLRSRNQPNRCLSSFAWNWSHLAPGSGAVTGAPLSRPS